MTKNKISALLVVYNEEKVIKRCLDSIKDIVDEIIVVHDGKCRDKTLEICKKYDNTKIYISSKNVGEAEPHRPFTAQVAEGEWLLPIDADEILSDELKVKIQKIVNSDGVIAGKKYDRFRAKWPEYYDGKSINSKSYKVILTRKSKTKFLGIPHHKWELIEGSSFDINEILIHKPLGGQYIFSKNIKKYHKWSKIHAKYLITYIKNPELIPKFNYTPENFSKKSIMRIKHPVLSFIPTMVFTIVLNYKLYKTLPISLKIKKIFFMSYYQIMVSFYLSIYGSLAYKIYIENIKKSEIFYNNNDEFNIKYEMVK